jgi:G3E family GTPase
MMRDLLGRTPVTIVTGFLGSGKTTLLNYVLGEAGLGRVAALVNDFGAINIDAELIATVADDVVQLTNGCVCCTINGDLLAAAEGVLKLDPPVDRIVVETTGLADPLPVGLTFLQTGLRARTALDAVITVVDCANFALDLFKVDAAMAQIVHGDIVVLNKTDLVDEDVVRSLETRIGLIKRHSRTIRALNGRVPTAVLLNDPDGAVAIDAGRPPPHQRVAEHDDARDDCNGFVDDKFEALAWDFPVSLSASRFQAWLDSAIPAGVFRGKGLVHFDSRPQAYVFQLCGGRASFDSFEAPAEGTRLVFIGRHIDGASLERDIRACLTS